MVQNYEFDKNLIYLLIVMLIAVIPSVVINHRIDVVDDGHHDPLTTPIPGNCPNCSYPDCGGCGGKPMITLVPTVTIAPLPTFPNPATPDVPDPTANPTVFPTFSITAVPPEITASVPTIAPTIIPPTIPSAPTFSLPGR